MTIERDIYLQAAQLSCKTVCCLKKMKDSPQEKFYMSSFSVLDATVAEAVAPIPCRANNRLTGELTQEECQTHTDSFHHRENPCGNFGAQSYAWQCV